MLDLLTFVVAAALAIAIDTSWLSFLDRKFGTASGKTSGPHEMSEIQARKETNHA